MGIVNCVGPVITRMTADATNGTERMGQTETGLFRRVTLNAGVAWSGAIVGAKHKIRPGEHAQRDEPGGGSNYSTTGLLSAHST
jgi:hypothetical protein